MRLSVGIHLPGLTLTSVDAEKHQCEMTQEQNCVRIKKGDYEKLVYIGNLIEAELYPID